MNRINIIALGVRDMAKSVKFYRDLGFESNETSDCPQVIFFNTTGTKFEANVTGKLSDRHFDRLMAEYDGEQSAIESTMKDLQGQVDTWNDDKLNTDRFIALVKRYTDFSELTTPMLNEFIEKVIVHEGNKRGKDRRQRVDIHMNFIGNFSVPPDIITPMEIEEQRRQQEEMAAKEQMAQELYQERYKSRKQDKRDFTVRMKAGLLTPEELEEYNRRREHNRTWQKEWRDKRKADLPPKPPKPLSINDIIKRSKAGLPLTPEEISKHEAYKQRKNEQFKKWRTNKKANEPPKPPKVKKSTKKEVVTEIIALKNAGMSLTPEEQEIYAKHRETRNYKHQIWRDSEASDKTKSFTIEDIKKRKRDGLPLTQEEITFFESWREKKNEYRRELYRNKKAAELHTAANQ